MDADSAVRDTDLTYMKGEKAHCGFPEIGFSKFVDTLVAKVNTPYYLILDPYYLILDPY